MILVKTVTGLKEINAKPFLRGLAFHPSIGDETLLSITHTHSGTVIIDRLEEEWLTDLATILKKQPWHITARAVYESSKHTKCVKEAEKMAKDRRLVVSQRREKKLAKQLGGHVQPGSGSVPHYKRDLVIPRMLVEHKTTLKGSKKEGEFRILIKDLEFLRGQSLRKGRDPAYIVEFAERDGIALIDEDDFEPGTELTEWSILSRRDALSVLVTREMSCALGRRVDRKGVACTKYLRIITKHRNWVAMDFLCFLDAVKGD